MVNEKQVEKLMVKLDLTREEALAMMDEDKEVDRMTVAQAESDFSPEQKEVAKKMRQADKAKGVYKFTKRERKPNELKREIIDDLFTFLLENWPETAEKAEIKNIEREITFDLGGENFSLTLTQHRKPKN